MPTKEFSERSSEAFITATKEKLHARYGDQYDDEDFLMVDGVPFYIDMFSGGDDLMGRYRDQNWTAENRKKWLDSETHRKALESFADLIIRSNIPQEDVRGVSVLGSTVCLVLCKGRDERGRYMPTRIHFTEFRNTPSLKSEKDLNAFGIPSVNTFMEHNVLILESEPTIIPSELGSTIIDQPQNRLKYLIQELGGWPANEEFAKREFHGRHLYHLDDELAKLSAQLHDYLNHESTDRVHEALAMLLDRMGMLNAPSLTFDSERQPDTTESRRFHMTLRANLTRLEEDLSDDPKESNVFRRGIFKYLEQAVIDEKPLLVLMPEGINYLPVLYLFLQIIADRYKPSEAKTASAEDFSKLWSLVHFIRTDTDSKEIRRITEGHPETILLVDVLPADDVFVDEGIRPEVQDILDKFGSDKVDIAEMSIDALFRKQDKVWKEVTLS